MACFHSCYSLHLIKHFQMIFRFLLFSFVLFGRNSFSQCDAAFNSPATSICSGGIVNFTNTSTASTLYSWKINEVVFSSSTNLSYLFSTAGMFNVELIASNGMGCVDSITTVITVNQTPVINVNVSASSLFTSDSIFINFSTSGLIPGATYFWDFCDGNTSSSSTFFYNSWDSIGNDLCVCAQINNNNGCTDADCESGIIVMDDLGFDEENGNQISLFPNPSEGNFTLVLPILNNSSADITILDNLNRVVRKYKSVTESQLLIERQELIGGIYHIIIEVNQQRSVVPMILL